MYTNVSKEVLLSCFTFALMFILKWFSYFWTNQEVKWNPLVSMSIKFLLSLFSWNLDDFTFNHDTDPCASVTCFNGGACVVSGTSFTCQCATGFTGQFCQTTVSTYIHVHVRCHNACQSKWASLLLLAGDQNKKENLSATSLFVTCQGNSCFFLSQIFLISLNAGWSHRWQPVFHKYAWNVLTCFSLIWGSPI